MGGRLALVAPFVKPVENESLVSKTTKRALRNQAITRSAPVVGRALSSAGLGAIAYGSQMPTTVKVQYSLLTKKQAKRTFVKTELGYVTQYDDAILRDKKSGVKRSYRPGNPFAETKYMAKKKISPYPTEVKSPGRIARRKAMMTGGAGAVVLGRTLPIIAVGYVGYSLLRGDEITASKPKDPWGATETVEMLKEEGPGIIEQQETILGQAADYGQGLLIRSVAFGLVSIFA